MSARQTTRFGTDPLALRIAVVDPETAGQEESIFALSNGRLGVRGAWEQGGPIYQPGALVNGFHETWPITYPEAAFGFATAGQTIVYLPDPTAFRIWVDGTMLDLAAATVDRTLELADGILVTNARWPAVTTRWVKLVSLVDPDVMAVRVEITAHQPVSLVVESIVDQPNQSSGHERGPGFDPRRASTAHPSALIREPQPRLDELSFSVTYRTANSGMTQSYGVRHRFEGEFRVEASEATTTFHTSLTTNQTAAVEKLINYGTPTSASDPNFADMADAQSMHLEHFWARHQIATGGDPAFQQAINWAVFQLHQASHLVEGHGVPAKGLSGQAYEGHVFWDMDVFMLAFVANTDPATAARLIRYRHGMLPKARLRARQLNLAGALYPWRTITGDEASAYYEAGTAQYHIDAAVIFGVAIYLEATGDRNLLWECGVEMAVETARMWSDLGFYGADGAFHIHMVTGPDEYTALVDDNTYTNLMARFNLLRAVDWITEMKTEAGDVHRDLVTRLDLDDEEVETWRQAAADMYIPFDQTRGINPQDARFLERQAWDWNTPRDLYPLLLHFHPLVIYRHQVLKQADVVMAVFNLPDDFSPELARADFDFYDPITTGDSTLSPAVQATVAAIVGHSALALEHFRTAAMIDLADLAGNTNDGVHLAAAGGVWLALVRGFGGFHRRGGRIMLDPRVPPEWGSLAFSPRVDGSLLSVHADPAAVTLQLLEGDPVSIEVWGQAVTVGPEPLSVDRP